MLSALVVCCMLTYESKEETSMEPALMSLCLHSLLKRLLINKKLMKKNKQHLLSVSLWGQTPDEFLNNFLTVITLLQCSETMLPVYKNLLHGWGHTNGSPSTLRASGDPMVWPHPLDVMQYVRSSYYYDNMYGLCPLIKTCNDVTSNLL